MPPAGERVACSSTFDRGGWWQAGCRRVVVAAVNRVWCWYDDQLDTRSPAGVCRSESATKATCQCGSLLCVAVKRSMGWMTLFE